jgi:protein disulfide-isomerase-like protein
MKATLIFALAAVLCAIATAAPTVLTSSNYNEITSQEDKVVLVKVYADWCGHCKSLAPQYEEVAEHFKDNEKVVIAKFDAPANEDFARNTLKIQSFPTIFIYKNGLKSNFEGARNKQTLIDAVEKAL